MTGETSIYRDGFLVQDATQLDTDTLQAKAEEYTLFQRDPTLNPRQRGEVDKILGRLVFELVLRKRDGDAA